ncbi:MAG: DUF4450 domain-containing protein [Bacteroidales bacterium]|nr:DUF4450 domain-containing protein [Bacteroidales bacterium]
MKTITRMLLAALAGLQLAGAVKAQPRTMHYIPDGRDIVCVNGQNRYTRALYGSHTLFRIETSDRPLFATYNKTKSQNLRFYLTCGGQEIRLDSTSYCEARFQGGLRTYVVRDTAWGQGELQLSVLALSEEEGGIWRFRTSGFDGPVTMRVRMCQIANSRMNRDGDLGTDAREKFDPSPAEIGLVELQWSAEGESYVLLRQDERLGLPSVAEGSAIYAQEEAVRQALISRVQFDTPDPFINTLGSVLMAAADGLWDGKTWLHGCIGWRTQLAGWRAAYVGDVVGWDDRADSHFRAYANSMVTDVPAVIPHPAQDTSNNLARAVEQWGTPMYSNGYICRSPDNNGRMHHYDMNLNYIDELLWHLSYHADTALMRELWPKLKLHLAWEKMNFDPDDDGLYDAYCCIWASDALYYNSGAVTHSSAYNYRGNRLIARIAELIGEDPTPYKAEADRILKAMNERLWLNNRGHWAEFQDFMGLKRLHEHAALWSIYTPIDCGACTPEQAYQATEYVDRCIPHIPMEFNVDAEALRVLGITQESLGLDGRFATLSTTDWMPYVWSTNNVAHEEVAHMALAYFLAGRTDIGFNLLKSDLLDEMFLGQSPGNFGQISYYDQARQEAYRDFGDNVGITSRAILNGLFGIRPDALYGRCVLQPAWPEDWNEVKVRTPYLSYHFHREGTDDIYEIEQHFAQPLQILVRAHAGGGAFLEVTGDSSEKQTIVVDRTKLPPANVFPSLPSARSNVSDPVYMTKMGLDDVTPNALGRQRHVNLDKAFNALADTIFRDRYLSPRSPYTTLEIPVQGMGDWCVPSLLANIEDAGLRRTIKDNVFDTGLGVTFRSPAQGFNVAYTSLWDNYPDSLSFALEGKASWAYLMLVGSTNNMQSRIDNAVITVTYRDGSQDTLPLYNPINWCPIEQDYFYDDYAYWSAPVHPYRIHLGSGIVSRTLKADLAGKFMDDGSGVHTSDLTSASTPIAQGLGIPDGAAMMLKMPLNPRKKLHSLQLRTLSNDVVVGLMGITLEK